MTISHLFLILKADHTFGQLLVSLPFHTFLNYCQLFFDLFFSQFSLLPRLTLCMFECNHACLIKICDVFYSATNVDHACFRVLHFDAFLFCQLQIVIAYVLIAQGHHFCFTSNLFSFLACKLS